MATSNDFLSARNSFREEIEVSIIFKGVDNIKSKFDEIQLQAVNKRSALDQALRDSLISMMTDEEQGVDEYRKFLDVCIAICRNEMAVPVLSVMLLSDIFDSSTIEVCEELFTYVEENVSTWKEAMFFTSCKNNILRMCNDLLRRLSRSQNTIFCGRILLFLAMFFPFSERSGLNIMSEFNLENETYFDLEPLEEDEESAEIVTESALKIGHSFYVKFWSLQDFFRNPNQIYTSEKWDKFIENSKAVLHVLKHYKVEADPSETVVARNEESHFFAKFLTSQKLLVLQLNDVHFRRTIYLQFLIIFQYLSSNVKSKPEGCELSSEQGDWVTETTGLVHTLIRETPPDGEWFLRVVLLELERDEYWSDWKNEGCPALKQASTSNVPVTGFRSRRPLGQIVKESRTSGKLIIAPGKKDERPITLNVNPDLLNKCRNRTFMPSLQERFEEIAQQADPAAMIEPQYKKLNSFHYAWSSLRVLASKSPHFYAVSHKPVSKLPDYLELMSKRILRDRLIKELEAQVKTDNKDLKEDAGQSEEKLKIGKIEAKENGESRESYVEQNNYDDMETKDSKETEDTEDVSEEKDFSKDELRSEEHSEEEEDKEAEEEEEVEEEEVEEIESGDEGVGQGSDVERDEDDLMEEEHKEESERESGSEEEERSEAGSGGRGSYRSEEGSEEEEDHRSEEGSGLDGAESEGSEHGHASDNEGGSSDPGSEDEKEAEEAGKGGSDVEFVEEVKGGDGEEASEEEERGSDEENNLEEGEVKDDDSDTDATNGRKGAEKKKEKDGLKAAETGSVGQSDSVKDADSRVKEAPTRKLRERSESGNREQRPEEENNETERRAGDRLSEDESKKASLDKRGHKRKSESGPSGKEKVKKVIVEEPKKETRSLRKRLGPKERVQEVTVSSSPKKSGLKKIMKKVSLEKIAKNIAPKWESVAERLGLKQKEIESISSENSTEAGRAKRALLLWWSNEEEATEEVLRERLEPLGLIHAIDLALAKT